MRSRNCEAVSNGLIAFTSLASEQQEVSGYRAAKDLLRCGLREFNNGRHTVGDDVSLDGVDIDIDVEIIAQLVKLNIAPSYTHMNNHKQRLN